MEEGTRLLERALAMRRPGPYQVQAAIAAVHDRASSAETTDWREIVGLYAALQTLAPSAVVELNRAVALAFAEGPAAGLAELDRVGARGSLVEYHLFHAARAAPPRAPPSAPASDDVLRPPRPTAGPSSWPRTGPSDVSSLGAWPTSAAGPGSPRRPLAGPPA